MFQFWSAFIAGNIITIFSFSYTANVLSQLTTHNYSHPLFSPFWICLHAVSFLLSFLLPLMPVPPFFCFLLCWYQTARVYAFSWTHFQKFLFLGSCYIPEIRLPCWWINHNDLLNKYMPFFLVELRMFWWDFSSFWLRVEIHQRYKTGYCCRLTPKSQVTLLSKHVNLEMEKIFLEMNSWNVTAVVSPFRSLFF